MNIKYKDKNEMLDLIFIDQKIIKTNVNLKFI